MQEQDLYTSIDLAKIILNEELPVPLYVYIDFRYIVYRGAGDKIDQVIYDRLISKQIKYFFIKNADFPKMVAWIEHHSKERSANISPELNEKREEAKRTLMDIFQSEHPDKIVVQTLESSKKLVTEIMKIPYAVKSMKELQTYSKGTADHSVNVSVLSTYLAMQMGYSHAIILQQISAGALMHEVGKCKIQINDSDSREIVEVKMAQHPVMGVQFLQGQQGVTREMLMIVEQSQENYDGSGYPNKFKGNQIYDLARIVAIANAFDELVSSGVGSLAQRQKIAVHELENNLYKKFDPTKLQKSIKILKLGV